MIKTAAFILLTKIGIPSYKSLYYVFSTITGCNNNIVALLQVCTPRNMCKVRSSSRHAVELCSRLYRQKLVTLVRRGLWCVELLEQSGVFPYPPPILQFFHLLGGGFCEVLYAFYTSLESLCVLGANKAHPRTNIVPFLNYHDLSYFLYCLICSSCWRTIAICCISTSTLDLGWLFIGLKMTLPVAFLILSLKIHLH